MLHLKDNLKLIRLLSGKTQTDFGQMFDATKAMVISYEKGYASPNNLFLSRVSKYAGVSVAQLQNNKLAESDIEIEKEEKEEKSFIEKRRGQKNHSTGPYMVPFIPIKAQAGYVKAIDQEIFLDTLEKYALPPGVSGHGAIWRYWEVEGDSMEPVFKEGDIVLTSYVHPMDWENLRNFYTYVIVTQDRILLKRIYCKNNLEWVLISENEEGHPQRLISTEDIKEVWVYRKTWSTRAEPSKRFEIKV